MTAALTKADIGEIRQVRESARDPEFASDQVVALRRKWGPADVPTLALNTIEYLWERKEQLEEALAAATSANRKADGAVIWRPGVTYDEAKNRVIAAAFDHCRGNKSQTAKLLDMSLRTLRIRIHMLCQGVNRVKDLAPAPGGSGKIEEKYTDVRQAPEDRRQGAARHGADPSVPGLPAADHLAGTRSPCNHGQVGRGRHCDECDAALCLSPLDVAHLRTGVHGPAVPWGEDLARKGGSK